MAEDVGECARDDSAVRVSFSTTSNGKSFARPCLSIRENRSVVSFEGSFANVQGHFVEDALLLRKHIKDPTENKVVVVIFDLVMPEPILPEGKLDLICLLIQF